MKIYRAIKTNLLTQGFGLKGTSPSMLEFYQSIGIEGHNGWDWLAKDGEPIYFDCDIKGEVIDTHIDTSGGLGVVIITQDVKSGIFRHRYWHLKQFAVRAGQIVDSGDLLGWADSTGRSTGTHLHRDIKQLSDWDGNNGYTIANYGNGYKGAIDIQPFYQDVYVLDELYILGKKKDILVKMIEIMRKVVALTILKNNLVKYGTNKI